MKAKDLIGLWESGRDLTTVERGLRLAQAVSETSADDSVGERNRKILQLREELYGQTMEAEAVCPSCSLETTFRTQLDSLNAPNAAGDTAIDIGPWRIEFRLPTSLDLAFLMRFSDEREALAALIERCISCATHKGTEVKASVIPEDILQVLEERLEELDPLACITISLTCPDCRHEWLALLDPADYVWKELARSARMTLSEIHELAMAYGWSEDQVLALPRSRRLSYLEMVRS